jgi:hypothetical protein
LWQDAHFMVWNFAFSFIMLFQVRAMWKDRTQTMSRVTLVLTTTGLAYFVFLYATMSFWLAVTGDILDASVWAAALILSEMNRRERARPT